MPAKTKHSKPKRLVRRLHELEQQLLDRQAELDAAQRVIAIKDAEIESLAGVVARDRERVLAETAEHSRRIAGDDRR